MWNWLGPRYIEGFTKDNINPNSYDVTLDDVIIIQRYKGVDYDDVKTVLLSDGTFFHPDGSIRKETDGFIHLEDGVFQPGDSFIASTREYVKQPSWLFTQFFLKSSIARMGLDHRLAGVVDSGFHGTITLEFDVSVPGKIIPNKKVGQLVGHLCLPATKGYGLIKTSKYQNQRGVTPANRTDLAFVPKRLTK